jgi:CBS domain-containing protein
MIEEDILEEELQIADERVSEEERLEAAGLTLTLGDMPSLRPPITCPPGTSVRCAIETMQREQMGFILIVEDERLKGMFTERDLLNKVAAREIDIDTVRIDEVMTPNPECLGEHYQLVYAINQMTTRGYRHIPIVDERGRPIKVISARNIVTYLANRFRKDVINIPLDPDRAIPPAAEGP